MIGASFSIAVWAALSMAGAAPEGPRPWEKATPEQKQAAKILFDSGVDDLFALRFSEAADDFRQAIRHWDLPVFHRNLAAALRGQSKFVEAREQLLLALQYGLEGMDDESEFKKAQNDLIAVESELSRLVLSCEQEGAKVTIDERKDVFTCPRSYEEWIQPGRHLIRIQLEKVGYSQPQEERPNLVRGQVSPIRLRVLSDDEVMRRPWPGWMPWTVMGAGLAVAGGGGWLQYQARNQFKAFDNSVAGCLDELKLEAGQPCPPEISTTLMAPRVRGYRLQAGAIGAYVAGGAALVSGVALLYLNAPRPVMGPQLALVPALSQRSAGVALAGDF